MRSGESKRARVFSEIGYAANKLHIKEDIDLN
jgi:hypothetical protein